MKNIIPIERIENKIYLIRGEKVMLDKDLAELYGVTTGRLNEQVRRNRKRFPEDFMFQLSTQEYKNLNSQFGASNLKSQFAISRWGGRRTYPLAFTEQGIAMLSSVLNSTRAIEINILIMRTFVKLRKIISSHKDLVEMFKELKGKVGKHDIEIGLIMRAIEKMIAIEKQPKNKIGFMVGKNKN